jgi:hypothetical protein
MQARGQHDVRALNVTVQCRCLRQIGGATNPPIRSASNSANVNAVSSSCSGPMIYLRAEPRHRMHDRTGKRRV